MQEEVRQISRLYMEKKINPVTGAPYTMQERDDIARQREAYRLTPLTGIDADGYQRFGYPDNRTYLPFDPATGLSTEDVPKNRTVQIKLNAELIRHLQRHPWQSPEWRSIYGTRNHVEASNKILKDRSGTNLGDHKSRNARGFAYTALVTMLGVAVTNITRIVAGIKKLTKKTAELTGPGSRRPRRTDNAGKPLKRATRIEQLDTGEPPGAADRE